MIPTPTIKIRLPDASRAALADMLDRAKLGQAIARGMDKVNEDAVGGIRQRISGLGVRRARMQARRSERRTGLHLVSFKQGANIGVDTGTLRRSIGRSKAAFFGTADTLVVRSAVGSNAAFDADSVVYAATHEYGRGAIPARPYVRPEIEARANDYSETVGDNIMQVWEQGRRA